MMNTQDRDAIILKDLKKFLEENDFNLPCYVSPGWIRPGTGDTHWGLFIGGPNSPFCFFVDDCSICFMQTRVYKIVSLSDPQYRERFVEYYAVHVEQNRLASKRSSERYEKFKQREKIEK